MLRYLVERIPEVGGDAELRGLTLGSCSSNLEAALSMFRHGIDVAAAEAPVTALEHARAMASRGHSVDVMLRFYRLGHEYFTEKLSDSLTDWIDDPTVALRTFIDLERFGFRYIDRISSLVAAEYVAELDRRQNQARAERDDVVRALLAGERVDIARAERVLSHRLTGRQIGFVCWVEDRGVDLEGFARRVGRFLGASHSLVVADGPLAVWGWASITGDVRTSLTGMATEFPGECENVHIAVGSPHPGAAGFRTSHLEALRTRRVIELSGRAAPSITEFSECCVGGCHLARPGCGEGLRCRSARRSRTRRRERARRARDTPGCSRRARESDDRSTHLGNPQEHGPAKGASCRRAQGPARNDQGRRTARGPTRVRRAGGLGVARVIASLTGARARWMCSQHTEEG